VNQHEVSGLVVPPGDPVALGDAMRHLLENRTLRQTLGAQASRRADQLLSRERMIESFRSVIETTVRTPELLDQYLVEAEIA
jgi:rhamnosyl/mannosyltransferase